MAIVIPLVMAYAGASATVIAITSIALTVTGINAKINKSASNVFGEDFVKVANIAGAVYGAYSAMGGGAAGLSEGVAEAGSQAATEGLANSAASIASENAGVVGEYLANAAPDAAGMMADMSYMPNVAGEAITDMASSAAQAGQTALQVSPSTLQSGGSLSDLASGTETQSAFNEMRDGASTRMQTDAIAAQNQAVQAAKPIELTSSATKAVEAPVSQSFFDKLKGAATSNQVLGNALNGAANSYAAAQQRKQQQAQYDAEVQRKQRLNSIGSAGWTQTQ